ncbi:MAG: helix-turn-helix transcriptional regulator [Cellulosilyticaceae bacterium]
MNWLESKQLFTKYSLLSSLIFSVPLSIILISLYSIGYNFFSTELFTQYNSNVKTNLYKTNYTINNALNLSNQFIYSDASKPFSLSENPRAAMSLIDTLSQMTLFNDAASSILVHFYEYDYFYSNFSSLDKNIVYNSLATSNYSPEQLSELLYSIDKPTFLFLNDSYSDTSYSIAIPLSHYSDKFGVIIIFINPYDLLSNTFTDSTRTTYLLNTQTLLADLANTDLTSLPSVSPNYLYDSLKNMDAENNFFSIQIDQHILSAAIPSSAVPNLMLLTFSNYSSIYEPLNRLNSVLVISILFVIFLSYIFTIYLFETKKIPINDFTQTIYSLTDKNNLLNRQISENLPIQKQFILLELIGGKTLLNSEILEKASELGLEFDSPYHSIFLVKSHYSSFVLDQPIIDTINALQNSKLQYFHHIQRLYPNIDIYLAGTSSDITLPKLIMPSGTIFFGPSFQSILDVAKSYIEARKLADIDSAISRDSTNLMSSMKTYQNYNNKIQRLINSDHISDIPSIILLIIQGIEEQEFPIVIRKSICLETIMIFNDYFKNHPDIYYDSLNLFSLYKIETYDELKEIFIEVTTEMISLIKQHTQLHIAPLSIQQIHDYLVLNLSDTTIDAITISDYFGTSVNYIDSLFLDIENVPLPEYILNLRLEHVKKLLLTTSYSLKIICEKTGFKHISSLISIFKSHYDLTPGQYRARNH